MTAQSGFTLIEALASGILSVIIAGAILSLVHLTSDQTQDGQAQLRLEDLQRVASDQIRRSARTARGARTTGEDSTQVYREENGFLPVPPLSAKLAEVRLYNEALWVSGGYRLGPDYLMEGTPTGAGPEDIVYKAFTVGADTVYLDSAASYFRILPGRKGIIANLKLTLPSASTTYSRPNDSDFILCRNHD